MAYRSQGNITGVPRQVWFLRPSNLSCLCSADAGRDNLVVPRCMNRHCDVSLVICDINGEVEFLMMTDLFLAGATCRTSLGGPLP